MLTVPRVGKIRPAIRRSRVDLPQPDGPSTARNSLRPMSNVMPSSAVTAPPSARPKVCSTSAKRITRECSLIAALPGAQRVLFAQERAVHRGLGVELVEGDILRLCGPFPGLGEERLLKGTVSISLADVVDHQRDRSGKLRARDIDIDLRHHGLDGRCRGGRI